MAAQRQRSRETKHLPIVSIVSTPGLRSLKDDAVASLAESMARVGQIVPITVNLDYRAANPDEVMPAGATKYYVISGRHRVAAAAKLGWTTIECFVDYDADEVQAELWEIAENLHRAELTALERSEQIARWVVLTDQNVLSQVATKHCVGRPEGGVRAAARELGVDKDDAHRAVKVASLSDDAKQAAKEVGLDDNRSALLQAARAEPERQAAVIRDIAEARSSGIDRDLKIEAARNVASRLAERFPASEWDWLKSSLYAAGAKLIADAFVNETGAGVSTMDKAGWA